MDTTEAEVATEAEASTSASAATSEMEREAVNDVRPQHPWPYTWRSSSLSCLIELIMWLTL